MALSLKAKLALGFGVIVALVIALGSFSLWQMGIINDKSTEIAHVWLPSVNLANRLDTSAAEELSSQADQLQSLISYFNMQ